MIANKIIEEKSQVEIPSQKVYIRTEDERRGFKTTQSGYKEENTKVWTWMHKILTKGS